MEDVLAFVKFKEAIANCSTLYLSDDMRELLLATYACVTCVGGFLYRVDN